jgi:hypothetical protein
MPFLAIFDAPGSKKLQVKNSEILDLTLFPIDLWMFAKNIFSFLKKIL